MTFDEFSLVESNKAGAEAREHELLPGLDNFTFVLLVARLYNSGKIDRREIESCIQKYGEQSTIMGLLRVVMHIYAYYMPLTIEDKQWISNKLRMPLKRIEVQRLKGSDSAKRVSFLPENDDEKSTSPLSAQ